MTATEKVDFLMLERFLSTVSLPVVRKRPLTFLGIAKQPHYENVWSNIYSFFFETKGEHGMEDLFISSLLELVYEHVGKELRLGTSFEVSREYPTLKKGWVDLVLSDGETAIIIENKVYHSLENDLDDYWDSVVCENKQGIVLSLQKIGRARIGHPGFVSITHLELMQRVVANLPKYFGQASEKYIIFLKDFYQNIMNVSNPMDASIIHFFNQHQQEINQIKQIRDTYVGYVISEVEKAVVEVGLEGEFRLYAARRNEAFRYYLCPEQVDLMITVVFDELFTASGQILFIVELSGGLLEQRERLREVEFGDAERLYLLPEFYSSKGSWAHFALQAVRPTSEELLHLAEFISNTLNESPVLAIYRKVREVLVAG